jgi:hypothetical protein
MKPMMDWVDAKVYYALAFHNAKFHAEQVSDAKAIESNAKEREQDARNKLLRMM